MESGCFFFNPSSHADVLFLGKADDPPFPGGSWSSVMKMEENLKRRPSCLLSSAPQSLVFDEEYYEEQSSDKKRRLTSQQVEVLEKSFSGEKKVEAERKKELATNLGLHPRQVAVWFQNRRARWKANQLRRDYHQLKSAHDYLLSRYNFILKQNQKLKAEVDLLSKKLEGNCKEVDDGEKAAPRMKVEEECGSPKQQQQQQLMDNYYYYYCVHGTWKTYNNNNLMRIMRRIWIIMFATPFHMRPKLLLMMMSHWDGSGPSYLLPQLHIFIYMQSH